MRKPKEPITGPRRFAAGDHITIAGLMFRIVRGKKGPDDLRLDWMADGQWVAVPMEALFYVVDFFYENEHILYPPPRYLGGEKTLQACRRAVLHGYEAAVTYLNAERRQKEQADRTLFEESA